jgi:hypothetical protein
MTTADDLIEACAQLSDQAARDWWKIHCATNKHMETTRKAHDDLCRLSTAIRALADQYKDCIVAEGKVSAWMYEGEYSSGGWSPNYFEWRVTFNRPDDGIPLYRAKEPTK